ncbi:MAG: DUF6152 family protein [Bryobacteraceae bacterium]|jgi:hypothetical protein
MRNALLTLLVVSAAFLLAPHSAHAHHGWAEFDSQREITLEGTVVDFHFVNPHCVVEFDVRGETGRDHKWQGEFSSPGQLARKGWTAASLQPGDRITITGNPAKRDAKAIHVTRVRLSSGEELKVDGAR